ncbi:MAG TPA: NAD-dependent epimerase/dehydratase family protein [Pyrinomonadaceae bacterium]|jgi:dTDP-L-rhamnose 4-epimerase|nr:NAD-dependent epimerase/dehydratase family protein [Pyrinomonadaceae bacterium]
MTRHKILVTGGAGFIGSHLTDALVEAGHQVRILDSLVPQVHGDKVPEHLNKEAEFIKGDICDPAVVAKALDGIEVVYHKAAEVGVGQSMYEITRYVKANDMGTAVLLEEMIKAPGQFKKLVVASSMSIYGEGAYFCGTCDKKIFPYIRPNENLASHQWEFSCQTCGSELRPIGTAEDKPLFPTSVYAVSKQDQEQYCLIVGRAYKIPTVAFRYFNVYGTRQALSNPYTGVCAIFSSRLLNDQRPLIFEDGGQTRDFVHVSDIVRANLLALETNKGDYEAINVGTGRSISVREIASALAKGLGKNIEPEMVGKYREGDIRHCVADISKAKDLLNYQPKVGLEEGLAALLDWVKNQEAVDRVEAAKTELAAHKLVH